MPTGATNLGSQLGQLLFGQPDDNKAYYEGQALGSLVNDRMASASASRAKAMIDTQRAEHYKGITPENFTAAHFSPEQAALLSAVVGASDNPDMRNLGSLAIPQAGAAYADAADATRLGDVVRMNRDLALAGGKPIETTRVTDGQVFNPYGDSGQAVPLTALGTATVGEKRASAADKQASAGEHTAHAHLFNVQADAGGFNPHEGKGGAGNPTTPSQGLLGAVLGTGLDEMGHPIIDQAKMRRFLAFQENNAATDPRYNDGDYALRQWAAQSENPPVVDVPADASRLGEAMTRQTPAAASTPAHAPSPAARKAPVIGTAEGGYIFKGGDPSKKENWVKASDLAKGAAQ